MSTMKQKFANNNENGLFSVFWFTSLLTLSGKYSGLLKKYKNNAFNNMISFSLHDLAKLVIFLKISLKSLASVSYTHLITIRESVEEKFRDIKDLSRA